MVTSRNFIEGVELDKVSYIEKGLKMLDAWEKKGESALLGNTNARVLTAGDKTPSKWDDI